MVLINGPQPKVMDTRLVYQFWEGTIQVICHSIISTILAVYFDIEWFIEDDVVITLIEYFWLMSSAG